MNPANSLKNTFSRSDSWRKVLSISSSVNSEAWNLVMVPCPVANQCALTDKTVEHETRFSADIFGLGDFNHRLTITVETPNFLASFSGSTYPAASIAALSLRANGILGLPRTTFFILPSFYQGTRNRSFVSPVYEALPDSTPPAEGLTAHSSECLRARGFVRENRNKAFHFAKSVSAADRFLYGFEHNNSLHFFNQKAIGNSTGNKEKVT